MDKEEMNAIIIKDGVYLCPVCGSRRILTHSQTILQKVIDTNSGRELNPLTLKARMSNRDKAFEYDHATSEGVGCWSYECRKCGWVSELFTE